MHTQPIPPVDAHPGLSDPVYRARRDAIAAQASLHVSGEPVPAVAYTDEEERAWSTITTALRPLFQKHVCRELRERAENIRLFDGPIPQLEKLNQSTLHRTGFRFEPVPDLVPARPFLTALADRVFLSTQYLRHPSEPLYTPEPDLAHEVLGHAVALSVPWIADLAQAFGRAARKASDVQIIALDRVFWRTMEFGVVMEDGRPKAFGAGLLSSAGELSSFGRSAVFRPLDLAEIARTSHDTQHMQDAVYVTDSTAELRHTIRLWLAETFS